MLYNARNGMLTLDTSTVHYLQFGKGEKHLLMIPGLVDGLKTAKGMALPVAYQYRAFAGAGYTVTLISRREPLPEGFTTRDMARDQAMAMDILGIAHADVVGVSMGGMIAQFLAADYPQKVGKLVLVVTCARPNEILETAVTQWMEQAKKDDHTALMDSNVRLIYSDAYYQKNKKLVVKGDGDKETDAAVADNNDAVSIPAQGFQTDGFPLGLHRSTEGIVHQIAQNCHQVQVSNPGKIAELHIVFKADALLIAGCLIFMDHHIQAMAPCGPSA